jgi:hypothetical protein
MNTKLIVALEKVQGLTKITVGQVVESMGEDALTILCIISILPFLQPIPIPGLSSVLGLAALLQGIGLLVSGQPVLTKRLRRIEITQERFQLIYKTAKKITSITSKISTLKHPVINTRPVQILGGFCIVLSAAFLSLPLPIPFSNAIPAYSIFFICVALLEDDIALMVLGVGITLTGMWMAYFSYHLILEQTQNLLMKILI